MVTYLGKRLKPAQENAAFIKGNSMNLPNYSKSVGTVGGNLRDTKDNKKD